MYIIRYNEIFLKGQNRGFFEKKLVKNIRKCLVANKIKFRRIERLRNRILIDSNNNCNVIKDVFGIYNFSKAKELPLDLDVIKTACLKLIKNKKTFRISAKKVNGNFKGAHELNEIIGKFVCDNKKIRVDLENAEIDIGVEIINNKAYVFTKRIKGLGGLPVGTAGRVFVLLEDWKSLAAAFLMLKRGCSITFVKKKKISYKLLEKFCYGTKINVVDKIPKNEPVVSNETLGNLKNNKHFKPLIAMGENEIERIYGLIKA